MTKKIHYRKKRSGTQSKPGIFLLPNLLTTTGLFFAFYAIVSAINGDFEIAAPAIFIALLADAFDGRVARLTQTTSDFGAHYDSLSDMLSFGLAPALLVYEGYLKQFGKLGWLTAFLYTAATALRLARFNTQSNNSEKNYFQGLACPAAAGVIAGAIWLSYQENFIFSNRTVLWGTATLAVMQVSNIRYYSFKEIDLSGRVRFITVCLIAFLMVGIAMHPPLILFVGFMLYALSGPCLTLHQWGNAKKRARKK